MALCFVSLAGSLLRYVHLKIENCIAYICACATIAEIVVLR